MSIQYPEAGFERWPRRRWILRLVALAGSIVSLASLWFSERARVLDDLQLSAEAAARPGEDLALRAFYLRDVEAPHGASLVVTPVSVRLRDARERELARVALRSARGDPSMEGSIHVPESVRGGLVLEARAALPGRTPLLARRALDVSAGAPRLVPRAREAAPLQQLALGPLRALAPGGEQLALLPRVPGAACVPEQPCRVLIWVGQPGAQLSLRHDAALTQQRAPAPEGQSAGFCELSLVVHGPEASLVIEARRGQQLVAERTLRLPVALGEASLSLPSSLLEARSAPALQVALPPGRARGIVDVFVQGRWRGTQAFTAAAPPRLPGEWFVPGLVRLQAHVDRFSGDGAGARLAYVRAPGESVERALQELVRALQAERAPGLLDSWAGQLPAAALADPARSAAFLLAGLEETRLPLPRAASARPRELARLAHAQTTLRFGVGALLALSALLVGMTLMRRGLRAEAEAQAILDDAEREAGLEGESRGPTEHSSGKLFVVCLVLVVGLAFLAAALLIVAKPLWF